MLQIITTGGWGGSWGGVGVGGRGRGIDTALSQDLLLSDRSPACDRPLWDQPHFLQLSLQQQGGGGGGGGGGIGTTRLAARLSSGGLLSSTHCHYLTTRSSALSSAWLPGWLLPGCCLSFMRSIYPHTDVLKCFAYIKLQKWKKNLCAKVVLYFLTHTGHSQDTGKCIMFPSKFPYSSKKQLFFHPCADWQKETY